MQAPMVRFPPVPATALRGEPWYCARTWVRTAFMLGGRLWNVPRLGRAPRPPGARIRDGPLERVRHRHLATRSSPIAGRPRWRPEPGVVPTQCPPPGPRAVGTPGPAVALGIWAEAIVWSSRGSVRDGRRL